MSDDRGVLDRLVSVPPAPGNRITFRGAGTTRSFDLRELYDLADRLALRLRQLGVGPGDRIGVLAANGPEWVLLDLAALRLKAVTAGFESGKFAPGTALLERYGLKLLFTDEPARPAAAPAVLEIAEALRLAGLPALGPEPPAVRFGPGDPVALKFTSGSTGEPKGLLATAGSVNSSLRAVQEMFAHGPGDEIFVFLPLSLLQQRYWVYSALCFGHDITVSEYASALGALRRTRPTVVMGVPGFFETAKRHIEARAAGAAPGTDAGEALRGAARRLFGDRIRYLWTGSAPASPAVLRFFNSCGLPVYEGYGLNETCIVAKNHPGAEREGSVGRVVPGKQVLFDADGTISVHSDHPVARRYAYAAPGESERVFGADGTVRTGDIGYLDADGFLFVQGRADDVVVLENGRNLPVRPLEERMKAGPAIEECVVFCPSGSELVAVVSPADEPPDGPAVAAQLARANAAAGRDGRIARVVVADERFTVANGLLSSQFKPLRTRIRERWRAEIEGAVHVTQDIATEQD